jgi:hypothetical protein
MNKITETESSRKLDAASRVGLFDVAIKKTGIIAKQGEGFTFHYPYGIIGIKSDPASVTEFIGLLKKFELDVSNDESIMDCHVDPDVLSKGGPITWEAPRYGMKKNHITLWTWLSEHGNTFEKGQESYNVVDIEDRRHKIGGIVGKTGTYGGL